MCVFLQAVFDENGRDFTERKTQEAKGICLHNANPLKGGFVPLLLFKTKFIGFNFNITAAAFVTHHEVFKR